MGVWGRGSMGAWKWGEDGWRTGRELPFCQAAPPWNRRRGVGKQASTGPSGRCACHPVPTAANHPAVVGPLQPLSQIEGRVEQPAGEGEAVGAGEVVGHWYEPGEKIEGARTSSPRSTSPVGHRNSALSAGLCSS